MDPLLCHESLLSSKSSRDEVLMFAEGVCCQNNVLSEESRSLQSVLVQVNVKLNDVKTRRKGLVLLNSVLHRVTPHVFSENCQQWAQHLKKIVLHDTNIRLRCLSMKILGEILSLATKHPEQNRHMASTLVPQLVPQLLHLHERYDKVVAHGLLNVLRFVSGACRPYSMAIQNRLIEMLSLKNSKLIKISSTCVAMLPHLSGGERGKTQAAAWFDLYSKLHRSLQSELNVLFRNLEFEQETSHDSSDPIFFPSTLESADPAAIFIDAYHRAINISACLQKMLSVDSSTIITVPVDYTLATVSRILKVSGKTIVSHSTTDIHMVLLYTYLPVLQKEALTILNNLILGCRRHLLLHDQKILNLFYQTLQWTSAVQQGDIKSKHALSQLRGAVYQVFTTWLNGAGSATDLRHLGDGITRHMLQDIHCERSAAEFAAFALPKPMNKKGKKRKLDEPAAEAQATPSLLVDGNTCRMALRGLTSIVYNGVEDLKAGTFKVLCSTVISAMLMLQPGLSGRAAVPPYEDVDCRSALYELLLAIVVTSCVVSHALLSKGIHIFSRGQMDRNPKITAICCQGLATCRSIIEPIRCSLAEGPPRLVETEESDDSCPGTPASEDTMEITLQAEIPTTVQEEPLSYEPVAIDNRELQEGLKPSTENASPEPLPSMPAAPNDEVEDEEMKEMEEERKEKEREIKEDEEVEVVEVLEQQSPVSLKTAKLSEVSSKLSESLSTEMDVAEETECNDSATDAKPTAVDVKPTAVDVILRSFVDSFPDDCESRGEEQAETVSLSD